MSTKSKNRAAAHRQNGVVDLSNEQIRQAARGVIIYLQERLPQSVGRPLQQRLQALKFVLAPVEAEHERLVFMYCKRDKKKEPVREGDGYALDEKHVTAFQRETTALWNTRQPVKLDKIKRSELPEKVEGKPLVVPGIVWEFLEPILTD